MGIRAGDRIATVDGKNFTGKIITNDYVIKKLRGKKDLKSNSEYGETATRI